MRYIISVSNTSELSESLLGGGGGGEVQGAVADPHGVRGFRLKPPFSPNYFNFMRNFRTNSVN